MMDVFETCLDFQFLRAIGLPRKLNDKDMHT